MAGFIASEQTEFFTFSISVNWFPVRLGLFSFNLSLGCSRSSEEVLRRIICIYIDHQICTRVQNVGYYLPVIAKPDDKTFAFSCTESVNSVLNIRWEDNEFSIAHLEYTDVVFVSVFDKELSSFV